MLGMDRVWRWGLPGMLTIRRREIVTEAHRVGLRVETQVLKDEVLRVRLWLGTEFTAVLFLKDSVRLRLALHEARAARTARHVAAVLSQAASRTVWTDLNPRQGDTLQDYTSPMRVVPRPACNGRPAGVVSVDVEN